MEYSKKIFFGHIAKNILNCKKRREKKRFLLLLIQYLNLTIMCVLWEQLMSVMKHIALSVFMSVYA